jgi:multiple sugar transport system substrate-binding protein
MSVDGSDTWIEFIQFQYAYDANWVSADGCPPVDDPAVRTNLVKALDSYAAIYRKGCTPPDALHWESIDNNKRFLSQKV